MKFFIPVSLMLLVGQAHCLPRFNHSYGEASFQFLKMNLAPRSVALAGAGAALNGSSLEATDVNPASAGSDSGIIYLGNGIPFREFRGMAPNITWNVPLSRFRLFLNSRFLGFKEIPGRDEDDNPETSYSSHTFKIQAGLAGIYHRIHWGVSANYAQNNIAFVDYMSALIDVGLQYNIVKDLWAGASLTNADVWTSSARSSQNQDPFPPTTVRAGMAYHFKLGGSVELTVTADARTRNDEKLSFPAGMEVGWRETLFFRTGYPLLEPEPALPFGAGIRWGMFVLDYSIQRHRVLSPGHYLALGVRF
jgi:hypothetical protein